MESLSGLRARYPKFKLISLTSERTWSVTGGLASILLEGLGGGVGELGLLPGPAGEVEDEQGDGADDGWISLLVKNGMSSSLELKYVSFVVYFVLAGCSSSKPEEELVKSSESEESVLEVIEAVSRNLMSWLGFTK